MNKKTTQYISASGILARVKRNLRSYFDSNQVSDVLFPEYIEDCLREVGIAVYDEDKIILNVEDHKANLPEDFVEVKQLWLCGGYTEQYELPGVKYHIESMCIEDNCGEHCGSIAPFRPIDILHKTTASTEYTMHFICPLCPGTIRTKRFCESNYWGRHTSHFPNMLKRDNKDIYDIKDGKVVVNFKEAQLYLYYKMMPLDDEGIPLVPDTIEFKDLLVSYISMQLYRDVMDQVTEEAFGQVRYKFEKAEQDYYMHLVRARTAVKAPSFCDYHTYRNKNKYKHRMKYELPLKGRTRYHRSFHDGNRRRGRFNEESW